MSSNASTGESVLSEFPNVPLNGATDREFLHGGGGRCRVHTVRRLRRLNDEHARHWATGVFCAGGVKRECADRSGTRFPFVPRGVGYCASLQVLSRQK